MRALVALAIFVALTAVLILAVPADYYPWVKAGHIIAVIAWMAGMLYLPRLFVYHAQAEIGSDKSETFKVMERRLLRAIINPAMVATWAFGLWLAWKVFGFAGGWLHDRNTRSVRHWRIVNEVPTLLMVAIVILVVVKPF